jgi:hypothetical protein
MPYIDKARRPQLDPTLALPDGGLPISPAQNAGELNFQITKLADQFVKMNGSNYTAINAAIGALECAKLELYRRVAAPYESTKLAQNGDVYS